MARRPQDTALPEGNRSGGCAPKGPLASCRGAANSAPRHQAAPADGLIVPLAECGKLRGFGGRAPKASGVGRVRRTDRDLSAEVLVIRLGPAFCWVCRC